jgi:hypothetical protein
LKSGRAGEEQNETTGNLENPSKTDLVALPSFAEAAASRKRTLRGEESIILFILKSNPDPAIYTCFTFANSLDFMDANQRFYFPLPSHGLNRLDVGVEPSGGLLPNPGS